MKKIFKSILNFMNSTPKGMTPEQIDAWAAANNWW